MNYTQAKWLINEKLKTTPDCFIGIAKLNIDHIEGSEEISSKYIRVPKKPEGRYESLPDGINRHKTILMLRTGVEIKTKEGHIEKTYPIGINLRWLIAYLEGKESPYIELKFTGEYLESLIGLATVDPIAWDAANELIDYFLEQTGSLPEKLRLFYKFNKKKPKQRGPHRAKNLYRDQSIVECYYHLKVCGYAPLMKTTCDCEPNSACHIIAECFLNVGVRISYEAVKSIIIDNRNILSSNIENPVSCEAVISIIIDHRNILSSNIENPVSYSIENQKKLTT